jgi:hypothetical protein
MYGLHSLHHHIHLVVVDDFDLGRITVLPLETNSPLIIDANTAPTVPISRESFHTIP